MRTVNDDYLTATSRRGRAQIAREYAEYSQDTYSGYGVGACVLVEYDINEDYGGDMDEWKKLVERFKMAKEGADGDDFSRFSVYAGFNINLSGMQVKQHAEQMALFQAIIDIYSNSLEDFAEIREVLVATTEDDYSLVCGHCIQVISGACYHLGQDPWEVGYVAASRDVEGKEHQEVTWDYKEKEIGDLMAGSYVSNRDDQ